MQEKIFLTAEANAWFARNRAALLAKTSEGDHVMQALATAGLPAPRRVLEIGCANGYRLSWLRPMFGCDCVGLEPSRAAVDDGRTRYPGLDLRVGVAADVGEADGAFDLIILGFCLYLVDRHSLFDIASAVDRKLAIGGHIAIFDFQTEAPIRNRYSHQDGLFSYKMNYARMFDWNPQYMSVFSHVENHQGGAFEGDHQEAIGTTLILKSDPAQAYPSGD